MKLFVITGTSRGLGAALADELTRRGHTVVGCSTATLDLARADQVDAWAAGVLSRYGPPDVLVNNAAVTTRPDPLWQQDPAEVQRLLLVNVAGVHHCLRAFLPAMLTRGRGVIVNVSSDWGRTPAPMVAPYCASKWAIEGLTRSLALELPEGVAAVSLDPGTINTDMLRFTFGPGADEFPAPAEWCAGAADLIESLGPQHNGRVLTVGGEA